MSEKRIFTDDKIQETMLGPLWARAKYSKQYPEFLDDPKAREIVAKLNYDFSEIQNYLGEWRGLGLLARAKNFDIAIKRFLEDHPEATLVNIGAGLDTTFSRVDNGRMQCFNLELPEAAKFRKSLIPDSKRNKTIAKSAFDEWFNDIEFEQSKGIFFIAGGFIYYFTEEKVKELFISMTEYFPGGELIFDATSNLANKIVNRRAKKAGEEDLRFQFGVGNPEKIFPKWSPKIKLIDWHTIWSRLEINPNWHKKTIKAIKKSERVKAAKIIHLKIIE
jgi:O-methyltransferase involved in polyketide biosynthesis